MTTTLNNAEKGQGQAPRRALSMEVADGVKNPEQFSMQKRPWRPRITPFPHILAQVSFLEHRNLGCLLASRRRDDQLLMHFMSFLLLLQEYRGNGSKEKPFIVSLWR